LVRVLTRRRHEVVALTHSDIEVADGASVMKALGEAEPEAVVNCAAFHRVDECESRPEHAFGVNSLGALNVARTCSEIRALCVYIGTDYVFDGAKASSYEEADVPSPINVYGTSKLAGEHLVAQACPESIVVRVASLFGVAGASGKGGNFIEAILGKAASGGPVRVVDDIVMSPTYTYDAAVAIEALVTRPDDSAPGLFHLTNRGATTWYGFASKILELTSSPVQPEPIKSSDPAPSGKARRPANSALTTSRSADFPALALRDWEDALKDYLADKGHL
jgi:dTDP-4-dehydrorhamnose reductase